MTWEHNGCVHLPTWCRRTDTGKYWTGGNSAGNSLEYIRYLAQLGNMTGLPSLHLNNSPGFSWNDPYSPYLSYSGPVTSTSTSSFLQVPELIHWWQTRGKKDWFEKKNCFGVSAFYCASFWFAVRSCCFCFFPKFWTPCLFFVCVIYIYINK